MWLVVIGTLLTILKAMDIGFMHDVSWLWVLSPFVGAVLWWYWSDITGRTKRRAMDKMEVRKEERRRKNLDNLGLGIGPGDKKGRRK